MSRDHGRDRQLDAEIASMRGIIADVRPASLDELGIAAALEGLAERMRGRGIDVDLCVELDPDGGARQAEQVETAIYRVTQEAIINAIKHAGTKRVAVEARMRDRRITLRAHGEGRGFDPTAATTGFGLIGMRGRVEALGGALELESAAGDGVTLTATLPARPRAPAPRHTGPSVKSARRPSG